MSLINQLQSIYPSMTLAKPEHTEDPTRYEWFRTPSMEWIGISKEELENKDKKLLTLFLSPASADHREISDHDNAWYQFVKGKEEQLDTNKPLRYRFVFFSIAELPMDRSSFEEALQSLFPQQMPVFFETEYDGFIIEEITSEDQDILSFDEIIDVLMSDFYTKIRFYISEFSSSVEDAPSIFQWAEHNDQVAQKYNLATVSTYKEVMPYLYIDALSPLDQKHVKRSMFQEVAEDPDLLHTIKVFLEAGANTSLAAKQLYMHRNSLQYRVDKFTEKTGIDVKRFEMAVTTYLALLLLEQ
ncbi:hypothetical protein EQV77_11385 [Halobacillus fulvus]|nr:hypothetical protein EQV77_11385 [Halobacillus fulvus]